MSAWIKTKGTQTGEFQLGIGGPTISNDGGNLSITNSIGESGNISAELITATQFQAGSGASQTVGYSFLGEIDQDTGMYSESEGNITFYNNEVQTLYLYANSHAAFTGNLTANLYIGDGGSLSNITGGNVTGQVSFAATANSVAGANVSGTVASATTAGTVTIAQQPNITSVGTLIGLTAGDTTITGNLVVSGNTIYANVQTLNVKDPIIEQGGDPNGSPLTSNDGKDRGQLLHYYSGSAKDAFMGWKNGNSEFQFGSDVSISNNVITINTLGNVRADTFIGNLTGTATTATNLDGQLASDLNVNGKKIIGAPYGAAQLDLNLGATLTATRELAGPTGGVQIKTGAGNDATNTWTFGYNGNLTLPANTFAINYANGNPVVINNVANAEYANIAGIAYSVSGANVSGEVANATFATSAGSATTASSATTAGTVTTAAQPNITSVGTLTSLTVNGASDLGSVGNITITGGTTGYVLTTNGSGSLSWSATQTTAESWKAKSVSFDYSSASTITAMTLPANAIVDKVTVIVDTAFNGSAPTIAVGKQGGTLVEYVGTLDTDLKSTDRYDLPSQLIGVGTSGVIQLSLSNSGSTAGAGRVIITYAVPL